MKLLPLNEARRKYDIENEIRIVLWSALMDGKVSGSAYNVALERCQKAAKVYEAAEAYYEHAKKERGCV